MGVFHWFAGHDDEPWRRLADDHPVEATDEDSGEVIDIKPKQDDPNRIEGLLIGFRYVDASGNPSKRIVLCYRCWIAHEVLYVRGYCTLRQALRTFRVENMTDVEETRTGREIANPIDYFQHFADHEEEADYDNDATGFHGHRPPGPWDATSLRRAEKVARFQTIGACIDGLKVLSYLAIADGADPENERGVETSYVKARLPMCGVSGDDAAIKAAVDFGLSLTVPKRTFTSSANLIAKEPPHFRLVLSSAAQLIPDQPKDAAAEALAKLQTLAKVAPP